MSSTSLGTAENENEADDSYGLIFSCEEIFQSALSLANFETENF